MKSFKKLAAVAVLAAFSAGSASAAIAIADGSDVLGNGDFLTFEGIVGPGSFADSLDFTVNGAGDLVAAAIKFDFGMLYKIDNLTVTVVNNVTKSVVSSFAGNGVEYSALVAPGAYSLTVAGDAVGNVGGLYVGSLTLAPVPEPETYAMFLAGLGFIGAVARRRSK